MRITRKSVFLKKQCYLVVGDVGIFSFCSFCVLWYIAQKFLMKSYYNHIKTKDKKHGCSYNLTIELPPASGEFVPRTYGYSPVSQVPAKGWV